MKLHLTSIFVTDQERALRFYTDVLGFVVQHDIPMGAHRYLTVVAPEGTKEVELLLEPCEHPAAKPYQAALFADGIPIASFATRDIQAEYERLLAKGVTFRGPPKVMGPVSIARFEDTCGNLVQLVQL